MIELQPLNREFAVCRLASLQGVDLTRAFTFLSVTDDEISLVCECSRVPGEPLSIETGWAGLKIKGVLDFGMIGVIAGISGLLAEQNISIFVISTYNTDFILVKNTHYDQTVRLLSQNGYAVTGV